MDLKTLKKTNASKKSTAKKGGKGFSVESLLNIGKLEISFFKGLKPQLKERYFSEMGMLLSAGVDLQTILELSAQSTDKNKKLLAINNQVLASVTQGGGLAEAMEKTGQFTPFDCYSVLIGENTGELGFVFNRLQSYYSKQIIQKRKITSALSYPIIVLCTTFGAIYFMMSFVVPMFADTLKRFGGELPGITKAIIAISENIGWYFLVLVLVGILAGTYYYRNKSKPNVQRITANLLLKIPIIGKMVRKIQLSQFAQAMDILLSAKVSLLESIELTQKMISFYPLSHALQMIKEDIRNGSFFYKSMEKQPFFDSSMTALIKIGEEVNQLDVIFQQLGKQYESELDYQSGILLSILEPITILVLAVVVGVILVAMYLPMFKIGTMVH